MSLVERYVFRITAGAFLSCLAALTAAIWLTSALRQLDVVTAQRQTILVFLFVTSLSLPTLVAVIAPIALLIATLYGLNRLNGDSELIVMSAAGMSSVRVMRPFLVLGLMVAGMIGFLWLYLIPASSQELRDVISRIRADFVANIAQEGQFNTLGNGVTFHYRERAGPALLGILLQNAPDENGRAAVYLAERGQVVQQGDNSYLVLENGSVHRQGEGQGAQTSIVGFRRYAIDLAALSQEVTDVFYRPRERSTGDLLTLDANDPFYRNQPGRLRAELHERLSSWLFPLAVVCVAFAALGEAKTTRQGRGKAIMAAAAVVIGLRIGLFAGSTALVRSPAGFLLVYGLPIGVIIASIAVVLAGSRLRALGSVRARIAERARGWRRPPIGSRT